MFYFSFKICLNRDEMPLWCLTVLWSVDLSSCFVRWYDALIIILPTIIKLAMKCVQTDLQNCRAMWVRCEFDDRVFPINWQWLCLAENAPYYHKFEQFFFFFLVRYTDYCWKLISWCVFRSLNAHGCYCSFYHSDYNSLN